MTKQFPEYKDWKRDNSPTIQQKFHKKFGHQMQEFEDFCEKEYARAKKVHLAHRHETPSAGM